MYFSSLMMTYVNFSVQVMETYLQRTSCMKLYLLHFHTEYMKKLSISVTKTTTKSVTYILLTTYLLQLSNNITETMFKCLISPFNTQHLGQHTMSHVRHWTIWHYTVSAANSNHKIHVIIYMTRNSNTSYPSRIIQPSTTFQHVFYISLFWLDRYSNSIFHHHSMCMKRKNITKLITCNTRP